MSGISNEFLAVRKVAVRYTAVLLLVFLGLLAAPADGPSYAVQWFLSVKETLVPPEVPVVALSPVSSFVAPVVMAFLAALLLTFPLGMWLVARFLRPALRKEERTVLSAFVVPTLGLFYAGCALGYFVVIPTTFRLLYGFSAPMDVVPLFALDDFVASVFFLTVAVGATFLLPVVMVVLSRIGLVPGAFWRLHWRGAILVSLLISAVITPDGSGVTMAFLFVPITGLYAIGSAIAPRTGSKA